MKMKVFISSEMNQAIDSERRDAVRKEIVDLGLISNCFEDLPGRRNPDDYGAREMCLQLVRESDLFLTVVDDTVTDVMDSEIREASSCLEESRIFFYFAKPGTRDQRARELWDRVKKSWIIKEFETTQQLTTEVSRSIASLASDALTKASGVSEKPLDVTLTLRPGQTRTKKLTLKKGDTITITCKSRLTLTPFHAGLYSREEYFRRSPQGPFQSFNFGRASAKPHFTDRRRITSNDDYYFVIRTSQFVIISAANIRVEIRVEKSSR